MVKISDVFGSEKLSYEEFLARAAEAGGEFGDLEEARRSHAEEVKRLKIGGAVEREAYRAGAKNCELLMRVIKMDEITVDDGGVHGIAEQIGKLRESDPYLFSGAARGGMAEVIDTGAPHGKESADPDAMSDEDYYSSKFKG